MKVSILIPLYNTEKYIAETIEFALKQTWKNKEIIIVDDGSSDRSYDIAKSYESDIVKLYRQENKGAPTARNLAFKKSSGTYIQYLDADDYMSNNKIEKQLKQLAQYKYDKDYVAFCPHFKVRNDTLIDYSKNCCFKDYDEAYKILIDFWKISFPSIPPHSYLVHRDKVVEAGEWNINLHKNQDSEYFARVFDLSKKLAYCSDTHVYYRDLPNSISKPNTLKKIESELLVNNTISKIILSKTNSPEAINACSLRYSEFIESRYPLNKGLLKKAHTQMNELNLNFVTSHRGKAYRILYALFGWRISRILLRFYKKIKSNL